MPVAAILSPGFISHFSFEIFQHLLAVPALAAGYQSHVGGVVPLVSHVQVGHVVLLVFPGTEGVLTEQLCVVAVTRVRGVSLSNGRQFNLRQTRRE